MLVSIQFYHKTLSLLSDRKYDLSTSVSQHLEFKQWGVSGPLTSRPVSSFHHTLISFTSFHSISTSPHPSSLSLPLSLPTPPLSQNPYHLRIFSWLPSCLSSFWSFLLDKEGPGGKLRRCPECQAGAFGFRPVLRPSCASWPHLEKRPQIV